MGRDALRRVRRRRSCPRPEQSAAKALTRLDGVALNRIAQILAGDGAVALNYKGLVPADVDAYVRTITRCDL